MQWIMFSNNKNPNTNVFYGGQASRQIKNWKLLSTVSLIVDYQLTSIGFLK